jgi:hypothetical protein
VWGVELVSDKPTERLLFSVFWPQKGWAVGAVRRDVAAQLRMGLSQSFARSRAVNSSVEGLLWGVRRCLLAQDSSDVNGKVLDRVFSEISVQRLS